MHHVAALQRFQPLSLRDSQELLLSVSALKDRNEELIECSAAPGGAVLPVALVYGANASGKTNLIEAIRFMQSMVLASHSKGEPGGGVPVRPFLLATTGGHTPSRFEIDFVVDSVRYHYGFEASDKAFEEEWLYAFPGRRQGQAAVASLLSKTDGLDKRVIEFLKNIRTGVIDYREKQSELPPALREFQGKLVAAIEDALGSDIAVPSFMEDGQLVAVELGHRADDGDVIYLDLEAESDGTQRLLFVLSSAFGALDSGTLLCVDELNGSLHTQASEAVMGLFCSQKSNPNGAQLLATTHDTNLLASLSLRRDEVWLTEKDGRRSSLGGRSNPCFELWLVLHERDYDKPGTSTAVQKELEAIRPEYSRKRGKTPNCDELVARVEEAEKRAILQLQRRAGEGARYANPSTTVACLVKAVREADQGARR